MCLKKGSEYSGSAVCESKHYLSFLCTQTPNLKYSEPFSKHTLYNHDEDCQLYQRPLLREVGDGPCKIRNPIVQPTIVLLCKQDCTFPCSIKALCLV